MNLNVYSLPSFVEPEALNGMVAAVIDVLRATSVAAYSAASGVESIITLTGIKEAQQLKAALEKEKPGSVLLGGERMRLPIEGFDLGNSPQHYTPERVRGKTLILTTTNGTVAVQSAAKAKARRIKLASFLNAQAVVNMLQNEKHIAIICAGTNGQENGEDLLLAGCLVSRLLSSGSSWQLNETAKRVRQLWEERNPNETLEETLRQSGGGKNLIRIGLDEDIAAAAQTDTSNFVPVCVPRNADAELNEKSEETKAVIYSRFSIINSRHSRLKRS